MMSPEPCLIARPSLSFTNATTGPVSMLTTDTARRRSWSSLSVIRIPLRTALFLTHARSGRQSWDIGMKFQNSEFPRQHQR
jgi:hypothetical protein